MSTTHDILFETLPSVSGKIGLILLNRPQALNALTHEMVSELQQQLTRWENDSVIQAVLIRSQSEKAFCAGGDIRQLYDAKKYPIEEAMAFFAAEYRLNRHIAHYKKPYVAFLDGIAMGGGLGISLHGSHRIGTEKLTLAMPETAIGFFPDVGGSYFLSRCPGAIGIYLGLTGARLKVEDALHAHLVNAYVPSARLESLQNHLLNTDLSQDADETINHVISSYSVYVEESPLLLEEAVIHHYFSFENVEDIFHALKKENDAFCIKTLNTLSKMSPMSLKVTLHQLQEGKIKDIDACLQMEYRLVKRFLSGHDMYEGIRALLIDKDQNPRWSPKSLEEITPAMVAAYFDPLNEGDLSFF